MNQGPDDKKFTIDRGSKMPGPRPPWQLMAFFVAGFLVIIGAFTWFWTAQDEVYITEEMDATAFTDQSPEPAGIDPQGALDSVTVLIGLVDQAPDEMLHEIPPAHADIDVVTGEIIQIRGQIIEQLGENLIVLARDEPHIEDDRQVLVLFEYADVMGAGPDVGRYALVQGELVRVSQEYHQVLLDHGVTAEDIPQYEGQLAIITRGLAH